MISAATIFAPSVDAADSPAVEIHGAVSAMGATSDHYNYLGETKDHFDVFSNEVTVNAAHRFANGLRAAGQVYAYKLDKYRDLTVDFAQLDYSFNEKVGVRVGRSKQSIGLYGDTQDIDIIRPLALLPLNAYPKAMRAYGSSYDGGAVYGEIPAGTAGSFDYHVYGGQVANYRADDPWLMVMNDEAPMRVADVDKTGNVVAGTLFWNTPVAGLKVGASVNRTMGGRLPGIVRSTAELASAAGDIRLMPTQLPPGVWDGMMAGKPGLLEMRHVTQMAYSLEYTLGQWVFASEYHVLLVNTKSTMPVIGTAPYTNRADNWYVMATWQPLPKWQFAGYYEEGYANTHDRKGRTYLATPAHRAWTKDTAVAASYNVTSWWLVKAQFHFINGTSLLSGRTNPNVLSWQPNWTYFVLKTTISF